MKSFNHLYRQQIEFNFSKSPYIKNFKRNPYSYLKARYYMFFASVLVYFLQNKKIHPNTITKLYIFFGFLGAFLLAIPNKELNYVALFLIFSKGILDWTDGLLARTKNLSSLTGHVLDIYGARIHSLMFIVGLGFYQYFYFEKNDFFLAALFIYPFCYGTLLTKFSYQYILDGITFKNFKNYKDFSQSTPSIKESYNKVFNFFSIFLDDRSRTIDFILLLIFIESLGGPSLSWLFFVGVNLKWMALWCGSFIFSSRIDAIDNDLSSKLNEIKNG